MALCLAPPRVGIGGCGAQGWRLLLSASEPAIGNSACFFSCRVIVQSTPLKAGRPAASANLPPPAPTLLHWLRAAHTALRSVARSRARHRRPCSPPGGFPEQNRVVMQGYAQPEATVPQSVAGRRLRALCRPRPQNGHPPPKQVGRRSPVAEKGTPLTRARREKPAFGGEKRVREFWVRR
ncbi:hypothetical protein TI10_13255 [Photorhabdus luminescens subsp. luminescens]|nr:hypothetical protein TI10_13255 [Photorhabdus luminescens subsp. luminescens]